MKKIQSTASSEGEEKIGAETVLFNIEWNQTLPDQEPPDVFARAGISILTPEESNAEALDINDVVTIDQE